MQTQMDLVQDVIVLPKHYTTRDIYMAAILYINKPRNVIVETEEFEANVNPTVVKEACSWATSGIIAMYVMCGMGDSVITAEGDLQYKIENIASAIKSYCKEVGLEV